MCTCISYNRPEPGQTEMEKVVRVPDRIFVVTGRRYVCIDACIADLVKEMWEAGIITFGCCCGHNGHYPRHVSVPHVQKLITESWLKDRGVTMLVDTDARA